MYIHYNKLQDITPPLLFIDLIKCSCKSLEFNVRGKVGYGIKYYYLHCVFLTFYFWFFLIYHCFKHVISALDLNFIFSNMA
jgi:hypothetical protein